MNPQWLAWAQRLQAIAQSGLTYTENPFEKERYEEVRQVAAEITSAGSDADVQQVTDLFSTDAGYATPKIDVRGVVFKGDEILLVKERRDGRWSLPGGFADVGVETSDVGFFAEDALPSISIPRVVPEQIARMFAHHRHPEWPPDFD